VAIVRPYQPDSNSPSNESANQPSTSGVPMERGDLTAVINRHRGRGRGAILEIMREMERQRRARENHYGRGEIIRAIRERENQQAREDH
jgi:hypothetical protein